MQLHELWEGWKRKLKDLFARALVTADEIGNEVEYKDQLIEATNKVQNKLVLFAKNKIKYENVNAEDNIITLPKDCYELLEVKNSNMHDASFTKMNNNQILVAIDGTYVVKYKAFLPTITAETGDEFEVEIDPIAEECLVTGVASWIAIDNPEIYGVLINEYNNLLANLSQMPETVNEMGGQVVRVEGWYW